MQTQLPSPFSAFQCSPFPCDVPVGVPVLLVPYRHSSVVLCDFVLPTPQVEALDFALRSKNGEKAVALLASTKSALDTVLAAV